MQKAHSMYFHLHDFWGKDRSVVTRSQYGESGNGEKIGHNGNVLYLNCSSGYMILCIFQNSQNNTSQRVSFTVCKLCLSGCDFKKQRVGHVSAGKYSCMKDSVFSISSSEILIDFSCIMHLCHLLQVEKSPQFY